MTHGFYICDGYHESITIFQMVYSVYVCCSIAPLALQQSWKQGQSIIHIILCPWPVLSKNCNLILRNPLLFILFMFIKYRYHAYSYKHKQFYPLLSHPSVFMLGRTAIIAWSLIIIWEEHAMLNNETKQWLQLIIFLQSPAFPLLFKPFPLQSWYNIRGLVLSS